MSLTPQQEAFAQAVASGKSQSEAYRIAYPGSEKWKPEALWANSSALMAKVSVRVYAIRKELADRGLWSREQSVLVLQEIATKGDKNADRVSAIRELNKMHGFEAPTKLEVDGGITVEILRFGDARQAPK